MFQNFCYLINKFREREIPNHQVAGPTGKFQVFICITSSPGKRDSVGNGHLVSADRIPAVGTPSVVLFIYGIFLMVIEFSPRTHTDTSRSSLLFRASSAHSSSVICWRLYVGTCLVSPPS